MGWISGSQQKRDHTGLRNCCAACGHKGTDTDPLGLDDDGSRVHERHFTETKPGGLFGRKQKNQP